MLLLTGAFEPVDEARARAVGCDGVLVKPFEPQMVISRVKDLLAGRRSPACGRRARGTGADPSAAGTRPGRRPASDRRAAGLAAGGSLEDYFDRLDAAFADLDAGAETQGLPPHRRSHRRRRLG